MPDTPVILHMPETCERCGRVGMVRLQQTITGEKIVLDWRCGGCDEEWPVRRKEQLTAPS